MYETLILLKPNVAFSVDEMEKLLRDVTSSGIAVVERSGNELRLVAGDSYLSFSWSELPHVLDESNEIAKQFKISSQGCAARFETHGDDLEMELFNDYLLINERLQKTGKFIIFDTQECKQMFGE